MLAITPADAHALTMVVILSFALGSLVTMFLIMARNGKRSSSAIEIPDDETDEAPRTAKPTPTSPKGETPREPWEQEDDWWKK